MILKTADARDDDIKALEGLRALPQLNSETRAQIDLEIRLILAGLKGEREASYEIDFHSGVNPNRVVIHDLRLEHQGRVAQIDHLVINRLLQVFVIETKHFSEGLSINEQGEFTAWRNGKPVGIPSPLSQNHRHSQLLEEVLATLKLPTRFGIALRPAVEPLILISSRSRITRPKAFDTSRVIKADQFDQWLRQFIDDVSLLNVARMVSVETLEDFGRQLISLHKPLVRDWAARFGIKSAAPNEVTTEATDKTQEKEHLTTSKLAKLMGISTAQLQQKLMDRGLLEQQDSRWYLTDSGKAAGGVFRMSKQYGPYFLWPADLAIVLQSLKPSESPTPPHPPAAQT